MFKLKKKYNKIISEVDNILNQPSSTCSFFYDNLNEFGVNGADDILKIFDYTYLIPNLFRKCFIYKVLPLPNICLTCLDITNNTTTKYLPYLLDENIIKSFLYFNFPVNIKYYSNLNNYINSVINYRNVINSKKKGTTYSSITSPNILYSFIYSNNSMLTNLVTFNSILYNQNSGCSYVVPWDYTTGCYISQFPLLNYIIGVFNTNNIISQNTISLLNYLQYTYLNNFSNTNLNYNDIILIFKSNIFIILKYAIEVYQDILNMYGCNLRNTYYCEPDYMNLKNIPILVELYNNFYNNQIYCNENSIPTSTVSDLTPVTVTIGGLIIAFLQYFNNYPRLGTVINNIPLNMNEALVFCCNKETNNYLNIQRSDYSYYYLNVNSTGGTQLYSYWGITGNVPVYTTNGILPDNGNLYNNQFITDFFNGVTGSINISSYIQDINNKNGTTGATAQYKGTITNGGIYDVIYGFNKSISYTGPTGGQSYFCNSEIYYVYNDQLMTSLNSKVCLTFETDGTTGSNVPIGVGLPIVYYPQSSNEIIYPPS
jgi:hypothetical protein